MDPIDALAVLRLVPELFQITKALEAAAPGRHFTPDGHLVGCIGEAVAAARYGLELTTASTKGVDAHHKASGRSVEIKATVEGKRISLRRMEPEADHLLLLGIQQPPHHQPCLATLESCGQSEMGTPITKVRADYQAAGCY